ncbi:MAG: hypothetical protein KDB01_13010 [Planctomycetaceae bacterium]|nr:hypothetical protein [Planctomycetaceae bacterium]
MKKIVCCTLVALMAMPAVGADKKKIEKPAESPGWLIIDEDFWIPLRFEPLSSLNAIQYHYRRDEEKSAAIQIDKAVSWLNLAASHAMPITKEKLTTAAKDLATVASQLRAGDTIAAGRMNAALVKAASALGEWHFYKAKESWGANEEADAGRDLAMAADYLKHAAASAHCQFGPDTEKTITEYYDHGWWEGETTTYDHNTLGMHLDSVEKGLEDLSKAISKAVK